MKKLLNFFFKKRKKSLEIPPEDVVFNVNNFNEWFNDPNNNAIYANSDIFLRLDKLSENHIIDYLEKKYGITNGCLMKWSHEHWIMIDSFYIEIKQDWRKKNKCTIK